ncbi:MAG: endonuclease/exonuclease/phosphatase family protein, partial [Verrucomicrobiota bacterium]
EGVGRDDGKEAGEFSAVLYRTDRFEKMAGGTFWLSDAPDQPGSITWGNACTRICSWVRLKEKKSGRLLSVYNGHFDHVSAPSRLKAARLIGEMINEHGNTGHPTIVMGDFNTAPDSGPISQLLNGSPVKFSNTLKPGPDGSRPGTYHGWKGKPRGKQIDYVLISPGIECLRSEVVRHHVNGRYLSDHFPVLAELQLKK